MSVDPGTYAVLIKVALIMAAVGFAPLLLVGAPALLASWRWVDESRDDIVRTRLSDPDLMAVAREVDGKEYQP